MRARDVRRPVRGGCPGGPRTCDEARRSSDRRFRVLPADRRATSWTAPRPSTPTASGTSTSRTSRRRASGELTYRQMAANARAQAATPRPARRPGRRPGRGRLAELGPAAARPSSASAAGAGSWSRSTSGSSLAEIEYIVGHSGADVVYVDPALQGHARPRSTYATSSCSATTTTSTCTTPSRGRGTTPDEGATATINYTSGTTARPKGVQLTHRNLWLNATVFGLHAGDQRPRRLPAHAADVPRERLGHAVRHHRRRRPARRAAPGRRHRDPAPRRAARRHAHVRGAGRGHRRARRRGDLGRRDPRPRPGAHHRRRRAAADPHDRAGARRARLGVHPDLRPHRDLAAGHDQPACAPSGTT